MYMSDTTTTTTNHNNISDDDSTGPHSHHNPHNPHHNPSDMIIELGPTTNSQSHSHHNHHNPTSSSGPKKRAETWVQDETRSLISLRRDMDALFNTSKSNKHLWEQISSKMRERGFDRSPTMCTDKWRNLLKEFKKAKHHHNNHSGSNQNNGSGSSSNGNGGGGSAKMSYYKEIEEILRDRSSGNVGGGVRQSSQHVDDVNNGGGGGGHSSKVDTTFLHFSDKGIDDASIPFGPMEANGRPTLNLERSLDLEGHPLAITSAEVVTDGGVPPSFWRDSPENGNETHSFGGRVITVKWGEYTRRFGVEGTADAIKDVIRSAFGLRSKRAFWLEDDDQVVRSLDKDMPQGTYTLHLDEGMTIKLCHYEESDHIQFPGQTIATEERTFYTNEDFRDYISRRGWSSLRELNGYRNIDNVDDLRPDAVYRGVT